MSEFILVERRTQIMTIGINRPEKKNAVSRDMLRSLSDAYKVLCDDPNLRCGVLYSNADLFCSGLDLMDFGPVLMSGDGSQRMTAEDQVDPFNWASIGAQMGRQRTTPLICAINGKCFTTGIELALGADIVVAEENVEFAQMEVRHGLMPMGGAVERFTTRFGWGNAMRWLLTGDRFDVHEAYRIGMVQEIVPKGTSLERALEIAERVATTAPLAIRGVLENAHVSVNEGALAAAKHQMPYMLEKVSGSQDLQVGIGAMFERRKPEYSGQ